MHIVEKIFLDILRELEAEDLAYAIKKNMNLALILIEKAPDELMKFRRLASIYRYKKHLVTAKSMLEYIYSNRYDFYQILKADKGYKWLEKNIKDLLTILYI